ncbi:hypothetical protein [Ferruginibacter profundus]
MSQDTANDLLNYDEHQNDVLPSGLNILTILTFIGCGLQILITAITPWLLNFSKNMMDKAESSGQELTAKQLEDFAKAKEMIAMSEKNIIPVLVTSALGIILCFIGALWMRKLKKDGYWLYIAGQIIPIASGVFFMGKYQFADWKSYIGIAITAVFIALYSFQKKYLVK